MSTEHPGFALSGKQILHRTFLRPPIVTIEGCDISIPYLIHEGKRAAVWACVAGPNENSKSNRQQCRKTCVKKPQEDRQYP